MKTVLIVEDNEKNMKLVRDILRHNLLQIMLRHPESVDEATLDLQDANVSRDRLRRRRIAGRQIGLAQPVG